MLTPERLIDIIRDVVEMNQKYNIPWALAGTANLALVGWPVEIHDVDILAERALPDEHYEKQYNEPAKFSRLHNLHVDWMDVAIGKHSALYKAAFESRTRHPSGFDRISSEWTLALKSNAGRTKDWACLRDLVKWSGKLSRCPMDWDMVLALLFVYSTRETYNKLAGILNGEENEQL